MITPLPPPPSTSDPATFQPRADALIAAIPLQFVWDVLTNTSREVRIITDTVSGDAAFDTYGWVDARGRS